MALIDKNIIITPNTGNIQNPTIDFFSATATTAPKKLSIISSATNGGELLFTSTTGEILSISNNTNGSRFAIFSSGAQSIFDAQDSGIINIANNIGHVNIGNGTLSTSPTTGSLVLNGGLGVSGDINVSGNINSGTLNSSVITSPSIVSTAVQGIAPLTVTSNTMVQNLNSEFLGGISSVQYLRSDVDDIKTGVLTVDNSGRLPDGTSNLSGSALLTTSLEIKNDDVLNNNNNATMFMVNHGYGGIRFRMDHTDKFLHLSGATSGSAGLPTDDNTGTFFSGIKINGNEVWHKGNDVNGINGVNAGTFDGLLSTQFLRKDINEVLSGTLIVKSPSGSSNLTVGTAAVNGVHKINVQGGGLANDYGYYLGTNPTITSNTSTPTILDIGKNIYTEQKLYTSGVARLTITNTSTTFSNDTFSNTKFSAPVLESTTTGAAPFTVQSNIKVTNLNADLLDGLNSTQFARSDGTPSPTFLVGDGINQDKIGFTHNDGQGNSNIVFNHANGIADIPGNVGRIIVNTDSTTNAYMRFGVKSNNAAGPVTVWPNTQLDIYETNVNINTNLNVTGNANVTGNITTTGTVDGRDLALDGAKIDNITVTQPVNLDTIEARVNALDAAVVIVGTWNVGTTFPVGTPSTKAGMSWLVGTGGVIDGVEFTHGDRIVALVPNASTTVYANNWLKLDYTDKVTSVQGRTGNVVITKNDLGISAVENTRLSTWPGTSNITQVGTITSGNWLGTPIPVSHGGTGSTTAASARAALGLAIGVNIQAHSTILDNTTASFTTALNTKLGIASTFYNNAVFNNSATTTAFIAELTAKGAFNNNNVSFKVQWYYANNSNLVTGHPTIGTIELAGCTIETWGDSKHKHIRITRPNTGTGGHGIYEYNDQGSLYAPGWREIWTSESDGSGSGLDADKLDGLHASSFLRSDIATVANQNATFNAGITVPSSITMGNCSIYLSGDLNHIHVNVPIGLIPGTTTIANAGSIGTPSWRWNTVYAGNGDFSGSVIGNRFISNVPTGTAPFSVASTTKVTNLNADWFDGLGSYQFLRSDINDTANGRIDFSGGKGKGWSIENGKHCFTTNDGGGNVNLRIGHDENATCTEAGYAFHLQYDQAGGNQYFRISTTSLTVGSTASWRSILALHPTGATISGSLNTTGRGSFASITEGGLTLSAKYLGINSTAADSFKIGGLIGKTRTNWNISGSTANDGLVASYLPWRNYGNSHVITDVSSGTVPNGATVTRTDAQIPWTATYPTLVGWDGTSTYGVRVDSARNADNLGGLSANQYIKQSGGNYNFDIASNLNSSSYISAAIEVREFNHGGAQTGALSESPRISFHWGGRVASQIGMGTDGVIRTFDNPGTGYENFRAKDVQCDTLTITDNRVLERHNKLPNATHDTTSTLRYSQINMGVLPTPTLLVVATDNDNTLIVDLEITSGIINRTTNVRVTIDASVSNGTWGHYFSTFYRYYEDDCVYNDKVNDFVFKTIDVRYKFGQPMYLIIGNTAKNTIARVRVTRVRGSGIFKSLVSQNWTEQKYTTVPAFITGYYSYTAIDKSPKFVSTDGQQWFAAPLNGANGTVPAFQHYNTSTWLVRYTQDSNGVVHISGLVKGGAAFAYIFTLPVGMRPSKYHMFTCKTASGGTARIDIYPNGGVYASSGYHTTWTSLEMSFKAGF